MIMAGWTAVAMAGSVRGAVGRVLGSGRGPEAGRDDVVEDAVLGPTKAVSRLQKNASARLWGRICRVVAEPSGPHLWADASALAGAEASSSSTAVERWL
jgi:hypothetical protein